MTNLALKSGILLTLALANCTNAVAQGRDQLHVNVGEARFYPSVSLEYVSNDNLLRDSAPVSTTGFIVAPQALFIADRRGLDVQFGYDGAYGVFEENSINFDDHLLFGSADAVFGIRKRGGVEVSIRKGHQALGSDLTLDSAAVGDDPVEFVDGSLGGSFTYGAPTARFNVTGGLLIYNRSYQNRADLSDGRSYTRIAPYGQVSYRLSVDTRALLQVRYRTFKFDNSARDREELEVLTGLSFRGSGKLSGSAKLGVSQPDYANSTIENNSILTVDTALTYVPSSLSTFNLRFERQLDNGGSLNQLVDTSQIIDDTITLSWKKVWSGFVTSNASIEADFESGGCPVDRSDTLKASVDIGFKAKRWMTFGLGVANTAYSESQCDPADASDNDYDLVELKAFVTLSL